MDDSARRIPNVAYALLVVMLSASLLGHYATDAGGFSAEFRSIGSGEAAMTKQSTESNGRSLLHVALQIVDAQAIQILAGLTLTIMIVFSFRMFSPLPPLLRPPTRSK